MPRLSQLRRATADAHRQTEALVDLERLATDRDHYRRTLLGFADFLTRWRPRLLAALSPQDRLWYAGRDRWPMLQADLAVLDEPACDPQGRVSEPDTARPDFRQTGAVWGAMYVLEGAALGGQVIARRVATLGLTPERGAAWFFGWGDRTGLRWREFCERLEATVDADAADAAVQAALASFDELRQALQHRYGTVVNPA